MGNIISIITFSQIGIEILGQHIYSEALKSSIVESFVTSNNTSNKDFACELCQKPFSLNKFIAIVGKCSTMSISPIHSSRRNTVLEAKLCRIIKMFTNAFAEYYYFLSVVDNLPSVPPSNINEIIN